jgi:hypothetical protein
MKISWRTGNMEKIIYNNHEIRNSESFKYLRSKIVINGKVKENYGKNKRAGKFAN